MRKLVAGMVLAILGWAAYDAAAAEIHSHPDGVAMCRMPLTKSYRIQPGFCPRQLVAMIPQSVDADPPSPCCGPFGIPPIYSAGSYVLVRQSPEAHERIATFLTDLGAYVPARPAR